MNDAPNLNELGVFKLLHTQIPTIHYIYLFKANMRFALRR